MGDHCSAAIEGRPSPVAPENTMAGFERAAALGADLIELDVRLTSDGALAIIHDSTVDRTTNGSGRVADLTWAEIQALDAGVRFGAEAAFAGQRVPSLQQVLEWARGRVYLAVEVKVPHRCRRIIWPVSPRSVRDAGMADQVTMHDIPQPDITAVRQVGPGNSDNVRLRIDDPQPIYRS